MDAKRQNKLLKLAIGRLQNELEGSNANGAAVGGGDPTVFLTENVQQ